MGMAAGDFLSVEGQDRKQAGGDGKQGAADHDGTEVGTTELKSGPYAEAMAKLARRSEFPQAGTPAPLPICSI
jgi:hypothetical protein